MQIYILLTENCNLNCEMCIRGFQTGVDMKINDLTSVVEKNDLSNHDIVVTGGEPSIHNEYTSIVDILCKKSKTVTVTSNGTLPLHIDDLNNYDNLFFQISLDGDRETHDAIRGKGSFERTWKNIRLLDSEKMKYSVASVISKKNINDIYRLIPLLQDLSNMRFWKISYEMPFGSADINNIITADEWNDFVQAIIKRVNFRLRIHKLFPFDLYDKNKNILDKDDINRVRNINCGSGRTKIYIYPDFNVYPCTCLTDFCLGNLMENTLDDIINSENNIPFSDYRICEESVCKDCEYKKYCNGGCIGMSYHFFGKLGMGDIRCPKLNVK